MKTGRNIATSVGLSPSKPTQTHLDTSWRGLYQVGAMSALLFVLLNLVAIVFDLRTPPPVSGGVATLEFIAAHRLGYLIEQVLWLVPGLFAMIVFVALYPLLKPMNQSYATLGVLLGAVAWALTLAIPTTTRGAPALVFLSDQYVATSDAAQRVAFAAAAEALIAQNNMPTIPGVLTPVGILIVGFVMLKGVFSKGVAYLGIATGILGIVSEVLRFALPAGYALYGLLLFAWFLVIGWNLYRQSTNNVR